MSGKRLVGDACVGRAAGFRELYPDSKYSRETLLAIKNCKGMLLIFSAELSREWEKNASPFANRFRAEMTRKGRVVPVPSEAWRTLLGRCLKHLPTPAEMESFRKDFHLVAASLHTDEIIISNERCFHNHLIALREFVSEVRSIQLGNPRLEQQACVNWIVGGAEPDPNRRVENLRIL